MLVYKALKYSSVLESDGSKLRDLFIGVLGSHLVKSHTCAALCVSQAALLTSVGLITPCSCKDLCKSLHNWSVTSISTLYALQLRSYYFALVGYIEPH